MLLNVIVHDWDADTLVVTNDLNLTQWQHDDVDNLILMRSLQTLILFHRKFSSLYNNVEDRYVVSLSGFSVNHFLYPFLHYKSQRHPLTSVKTNRQSFRV